MKTLLHFYILFIPFIGFGQTLFPDAHWNDGNHRSWCDKGIGTAFTSNNGILTSFNYQGNGTRNGGHVYMYTIDEALKTSQTDLSSIKMNDFKLGPSSSYNNKIEFGFPGEGSSYDEGPVIGRAFFFQYESQIWYFIHIRSAHQPDGQNQPDNASYECYARIPVNTAAKCFTYYNTSSPVSKVLKQGAFQCDSLVYFLAYDQSVTPHCWQFQEFRFDSTNSHFKYNERSIEYSYLTYPYLGGLDSRLDSLGNTYFLATFYDQAGNWQVGKLIPGTSGGKRNFIWQLLLDNSHSNPFTTTIAATALFDGTIKGNRVAADIPNKTQSDRLILFGECKDKSSDGFYHVQYGEYHFVNDVLVLDGKGEIALPSATGAYKVSDYYHLNASYMLIPKDYQTVLSGTDGFQQYMWLIYPDHNRYFNGAMFQSDFWTVSPKYEYSPDLDNNVKYPGISTLWTLVGIVDGPPPVSMNWSKWDSTWGFPWAPTTLELETDSSGATEFTTQTENEWSVGLDLEIKGKRQNSKYQLSAGGAFKFAQQFENTVSGSQTHQVTYTTPFEMEEESQEYGYFLYIVPQIKRYSFSAFPWWDDPMKQEYPVEGSFQFMFQTIGNQSLKYPVPLNNPIFDISEPNAASMEDWSWDQGRQFLLDQANSWGLVPVINLSWSSPGNGNGMNIQTSVEAKQSDAQTKSWEFEVHAGVTETVPHVCKLEATLSTDYKGTLMSETASTAEYGHKIFASIERLTNKEKGVNIGKLSISGYLFTNDVNSNWWFYDSLNYEKPFYLAWVVTSAEQSLLTITPSNGDRINRNDLLFTWRPDQGTLEDYELLISKTTPMANPNIIYRKKVSDATETFVADLSPEPGVTYYWTVKALDKDGNTIYAPVSNFTVQKVVEQEKQLPAMNTVVTSNPGSRDEIRIIVNPVSNGPITLSVRNLSGLEVYRQVIAGTANQVIQFSFARTNLANGLYFAVIRSTDQQVVMKIIIRK